MTPPADPKLANTGKPGCPIHPANAQCIPTALLLPLATNPLKGQLPVVFAFKYPALPLPLQNALCLYWKLHRPGLQSLYLKIDLSI